MNRLVLALTAALATGSILLALGCGQPTSSAPTVKPRLTSAEAPAEDAGPATPDDTPGGGDPTAANAAETNGRDAATADATKAQAKPLVEGPAPSGDAGDQLALANASRGSGKVKDVTFDDLKFDIEPASRYKPEMLTEAIKELQGEKIRVRGYMLPTFKQAGIKQFVLLMNTKCKFGSPTDPVWCNARVQVEQGEGADFTTRPVTVEGVLKLDPLKGPKYDISLYYIDGAKVTR